jgi:hypothetical protein
MMIIGWEKPLLFLPKTAEKWCSAAVALHSGTQAIVAGSEVHVKRLFDCRHFLHRFIERAFNRRRQTALRNAERRVAAAAKRKPLVRHKAHKRY